MNRGKCFASRAAGGGMIFGLLTLASTLWGANWTNTTPLPDGYYGHSLAYYSNFLYQAGGASTVNGGADGVNVFYSKVNTNGTIGAWTLSTSLLPDPVYEHAGVAADGFLYVLGGYHSPGGPNIVSNSVYYAKINSDGSVGSWHTANPLPYIAFSLSASAWNHTIYVVGGSDGQVLFNNVYSAKIQTDGSLSAWVAQPSLPVAIYLQAEAANGFLYVVGGAINDGSTTVSTVYYSKINADGSLVGWNLTTPLPQPDSWFGAVVAGGRIFTMAGLNGSAIINAFYSAPVMGDGTLGAWSAGTSLPQPLYNYAVAVTSSNIYVTGGLDVNGNYLSTVYSMALPAAPGAPSLTRSNFVNGSFQLRLASAQTNCGFGLLASTNLTAWTNIAWGFTGTNGLLTLKDTNASHFPKRFYKAYWPLP